MTRPRRFLTRMILFLAAVAGVVMLLFPILSHAFSSNVPLNSMILGVLLIGIVFIFRQVLILYPEVQWIETFRRDQPGVSAGPAPRLLGPMAAMLGARGDKLSLSALSLRSLLDSLSARLDESRDISRYLIGLLILLGLLGTFWGLIGTMNAVGTVIAGLEASSGDFTAAFGDLKKGLEAPLGGMGTAFSSSLFGLSGSLILGFLDLQAGQALNRFYNDLEEWLAGQTRLSSGSGLAEGEQSVPVYIQALLEQTADNLQNLQSILSRGEDRQSQSANALITLNDRLSALTDQMRTEQNLMMRLAESQIEMKSLLARIAEQFSGKAGGLGGMDDATRGHIRNLDLHLARLVEDISTGREAMLSDLRSEIKVLARTIGALSNPKKP